MIKYSNEKGFIKAKPIKSVDKKKRVNDLPEIAVGVFSHHLYEDVISKFPCEEKGVYQQLTRKEKFIS